MPRREFRDGVRAILGLTPAAFAFGASFAVLARAAGVGGVAATVMSAAAFPALFLALLAPQLRSRRAVAAAAIGAAIAFALIPFTPAGVPIVAATAGCLVGWRR